MRRHFIDNALYWPTEYPVDGLRLDASHGSFDFGARHGPAEVFHEQARRLGRTAWLIAESNLNDTRVIDPPERGGWGLDALWSHDPADGGAAAAPGTRAPPALPPGAASAPNGAAVAVPLGPWQAVLSLHRCAS